MRHPGTLKTVIFAVNINDCHMATPPPRLAQDAVMASRDSGSVRWNRLSQDFKIIQLLFFTLVIKQSHFCKIVESCALSNNAGGRASSQDQQL